MMAVALSIEYPIDTAGTEPQVAVLAVRVKGEVTCAPFAGVVTVMANVEAAEDARTKTAESKVFI